MGSAPSSTLLREPAQAASWDEHAVHCSIVLTRHEAGTGAVPRSSPPPTTNFPAAVPNKIKTRSNPEKKINKKDPVQLISNAQDIMI